MGSRCLRPPAEGPGVELSAEDDQLPSEGGQPVSEGLGHSGNQLLAEQATEVVDHLAQAIGVSEVRRHRVELPH